MSKLKNVICGGVFALVAVALMAGPVAAVCEVNKDLGGVQFVSASTDLSSSGWRKCAGGTFTQNGQTYQAWGKSAGDCSRAGSMITDPE